MTITVHTLGQRLPFRVAGLPADVIVELCRILPADCRIKLSADWLTEREAEQPVTEVIFWVNVNGMRYRVCRECITPYRDRILKPCAECNRGTHR